MVKLSENQGRAIALQNVWVEEELDSAECPEAQAGGGLAWSNSLAATKVDLQTASPAPALPSPYHRAAMSDTSPATDAESMALVSRSPFPSSPNQFPYQLANQSPCLQQLGPVLLGASAHLLLVGILLCSFTHHLTSPGPSWSSTSRRLKRVIVFVVGLTTFIAALHINDILHFGTLQSRDASSLLRGTKIEAVEPVLVGVVGSVVHSVLVYRASRVSASLRFANEANLSDKDPPR